MGFSKKAAYSERGTFLDIALACAVSHTNMSIICKREARTGIKLIN